MPDSITLRRIKTARDILVGKLPDPRSQVEQITIALIYKFMDDMDQDSIALGGNASFFAGDYARYAWSKIFDPRLGGLEMLNLYAEAITQMTMNTGLPTLFRAIFKNAYLPYRDPETLRLFLKTINEFHYDHSEDLGDAFEYLLSIMDSQGKAGQFRTPRHIIDFMVRVVKPQKHETVLDPACGTAGYLISAYKYILAANQQRQPGDLLLSPERTRLLDNFTGYDISPDMVRLSLVNLYLHGFTKEDIHIYEYDTLTSQERWNEYADVILANPPFMSPKGGIRPHTRFSVPSNRSEVLFVDYIAEHLTPKGRGAVIVPEGIIFQSGTAYKSLRKYLVEKHFLWAVASLPAGIFNPYSGVKTSILFFDKALARKTEKILFVKIAADGYDLGAQRRKNGKDDLPAAAAALEAWHTAVHAGSEGDFDTPAHPLVLLVEKSRLAENGEYNLSMDRYREVINLGKQKWPMVALGDELLFSIESGGTPNSTNQDFWDGDLYWATLVDLPQDEYISLISDTRRKITLAGLKNSSAKIIEPESVIVSSRATIGRVGINKIPLATNQGFKNIIIKDKSAADTLFVAHMVKRLVPKMEFLASGGTFKEISKSSFSTLKIPLPPLDVQRQIVDEIAGYQRIIDSARQIVEAWKPEIAQLITEYLSNEQESFAFKTLGEICELISGQHIESNDYSAEPSGTPYLTGPSDFGIFSPVITKWTTKPKVIVSKDDILITVKGSGVGKLNFLKTDQVCISRQLMAIRPLNTDSLYVYYWLFSKTEYIQSKSTGMAIPGITRTDILEIEIPLPPLDVQREIVARIEKERAIIEANRELIGIYQRKIDAAVNRVWQDG
jgi:type I restriction enzyme M protein